MGKPIATIKSGGICFAFPDVCRTPPPAPGVPIPYPNTGKMEEATEVTTTVNAGGNSIITEASQIPITMGDEAGTGGAVKPGAGPTKGKVEFKTFSGTVKAQGNRVVRMFDSTTQNNGNAVGQVLGGEATVLVGD